MTVLAGVDGCPAGWIAVFSSDGLPPRQQVFPSFSLLLQALGPDAVIAVDMPIGLPDRIGAGGRGPEQAARRHLGDRQSSVFSIPSRAAVHARDYREACELAIATSDPPRKVSKQGFHLFGKIREIDELMTPALQERVREAHPELAFCVLNGMKPMASPKKIKGRVNPEGIAERKALLANFATPAELLSQPPARGAAADDFVDACVLHLVAGRVSRGEAIPHPSAPARDARGLLVAIWA